MSNEKRKTEKKFALDDLNQMPGGFFIYKADWDKEEIIYANKVMLDIFECNTLDEFKILTNNSFSGIVHPDDYVAVKKNIRTQIEASEDHFDQVNYRIITKTGKIKYIEDYGKYYESKEYGPLFYVFISNAQIKIDTLTGLPRRRHFLQLAKKFEEESCADQKVCAIAELNLIGLKNFNSKYGLDEGDILLRQFAGLIIKNFGSQHSARFSDDNFYVIGLKNEMNTKLKNIVEELKELNNGRTVPVRIGVCECDNILSIEDVCSRAKITADSLKTSVVSAIEWYNDSISYKLLIKDYVLNHIDQALSEGWIEPYYQPVVRTLTKRLCSVEALARWNDPLHGLIPQTEFIPILEEAGISYKLDMYIVERVVSMLQQRIKEGLPVVPVSINVSRADFEAINPVDIISSSCDLKNVRRSLIAIEITETALISDRGLIRNAITEFHNAGFEVWMDDFGSGYSSLNFLKDFDFDEIKLDMGFIRDFNEKSRKIITMAVKMAKSLGIHTLAEGVETEEHFRFLKSIGCERIQGFYYGKPLPLSDQIENLKRKGFIFETREVADLYQETGKLDLVSEFPLALFYFDGKRYTTIFRNQKYLNELPDLGDDPDEAIDINMNSDKNPLAIKFRTFGNKVLKSEKRETMTFTASGHYYTFSLTPIAKTRNGMMMKAELMATSFEEQKEISERDFLLRVLGGLYNCVYLLDFDDNTKTVITSILPNEHEGDVTHGLHQIYHDYEKFKIYDEEIDRWKKFTDSEYLLNRARSSGKGYFTDMFLTKREDGTWYWLEILVVSLSESNSNKILVATKPSGIEDYDDKTDIIKRIIKYGSIKFNKNENIDSYIIDSINNMGNLKLFWKDKNRRFLGATKAFLDFYGFKSIDDILGKTDEDLGWHLNDEPFESDELRVLNKGEIIDYATTVNMVNGVAHHIIASKIPIYKDNKIIGLVGYFVDSAEDWLKNDEHKDKRLLDPVTGLMNAYGLTIAVSELEDNYRTNKENYIYVVFNIVGYNEVLDGYGIEEAHDLLRLIADKLKKSFRKNAVISRNEGARFSCCERGVPNDVVFEEVTKFVNEIDSIHEFNGKNVRLKVEYGTAAGNESDYSQNVIAKAARRLSLINQIDVENSLNYGKYQINEIPLPCVIVRPRHDENGKVSDMEFVYVNSAYSEMTGRRYDELVGRGYLESFSQSNPDWIKFTYRATQGEYVRSKLYDGAGHHWLRFTAAPSEVSGACVVVCEIIDDEINRENKESSSMATNEIIVKLTRILNVDSNPKDALERTLKELGIELKASRTYVYITDSIINNIFEWDKDGVSPERINSNYLAFDILKSWENHLKEDSSVIIKNTEDLRMINCEIYNYYKINGIICLLASPIYLNSRLSGYLVIENFENDSILDPQKISEALAYFISSKMNIDLERKRNKESLDKALLETRNLMSSNLSLEIAKELGKDNEYEKAIEKSLDMLSNIFHPDRLYILELDGDYLTNTFELCNVGVKSLKKEWHKIAFKNYMTLFGDFIKKGKALILDDIQDLKKQTVPIYKLWKNTNVNRIIIVPFYNKDELIGFIGMDNYNISSVVDVKKMLENVAYFIGYKILLNKYREKNIFDQNVEVIKNDETLTKERANQFLNTYYDTFKEAPIPGAFLKIVLSDDSKYATDFIYIDVNEKYCKMVNRSREELTGHTYKEVFENPDYDIIHDVYEASILDKVVNQTRFSQNSNRWVFSIISPTKNPGYCSAMIIDINDIYCEYEEKYIKEKIYSTVIEAARTLNSNYVYDKAMNGVLEVLSKFIRAEHINIITLEGKYFKEEFEWTLDGVKSYSDRAVKLERSLLLMGKDYYDFNKDYLYDDIEDIEKMNLETAKVMKDKHIRNVLYVPLYDGEVVIGYLGIQNFDKQLLNYYKDLMIEVSYFISNKMVVQNTHSDISNKNRELIAENKNMIDAISNAYIALLEINITTGLVLPISLPSTFSSKYIKNWQNYDVIKDEFINNFVDEKDKDKIMEFIDGYTLNERLKGKRFISKLYNGINGEKREIVYSVSKRDKDGNVLELFLSISGKDE